MDLRSCRPIYDNSSERYVFCADCCGMVFEYCAIHGPLLVIPDHKVSEPPEPSSVVPRAALTIPAAFLHLNRSHIVGSGLGVFATRTLPRGVRFGPYKGKKTQIPSAYSWQIQEDSGSSYVDASDDSNSNWMRYVNCSRHWDEQNLVAYQYCGAIYYRTIKVVPPFTELLVFYGAEAALSLGIDLKRCYPPRRIFMGKANEISKPNTIGQSFENVENEEHNINSYICDYCGSGIHNKQDLIKHIQNHMTENKILNYHCQSQNFYCEICPYKSTQKLNLVQHMTKHGYSLYSCTLCNYCSNKKKNLVGHTLSHNTEKKFSCQFCDYKCTQKRYLLSHVKDHLSRNCYRCEFCPYNTLVKQHLIEHIAETHTDEKYSCNICAFRCTKRRYLTRHIQVHSTDKKFQCQRCPYKTSSRRYLSVHTGIHDTDKRFSCKICTYKCTQKKYLSKHIKTHSTDKRFSCTHCPYKTTSRGNLTKHLKIHITERRFTCNICPFKCKLKTYLLRHMDIHNTSMCFRCDLCPYETTNRRYLLKHTKTHVTEKMFLCNTCQTKFKQKSYLQKHLKNMH